MVKKLIGKKLKSSRLKRDKTIQQLAEKSRVSSNMISRIERGLTTPSVEILMKLADAVGVSLSYFVEEAEKGSTVVFTPSGQGDPIFFFENKHQIFSLSQGLRDPGFSAFIDVLEPLCDSGEGGMVHTGEEFAMVLEGSLDFTIDAEKYHLEVGDTIAFKATLPHSWKNKSGTRVKVLWIVSPPPNV
ncbi:helix-turn-helix domain-containing protein [Geopsychrobacter electrodiphilus]|uniref:helix-turn-helix domain-containing protein n=1 Tax=Geopsychrobacter electrodiphilus TaxID=225196 RepID=UPI0003628F5C|nr:cupin domain-containing protein [Geopsychrobacter electrodiphilus]